MTYLETAHTKLELDERSFAIKIDISGKLNAKPIKEMSNWSIFLVLGWFLKEATCEFDFQLSACEGEIEPQLQKVTAIGVVASKYKEDIRVAFNLFIAEMQDEYQISPTDLLFHLESTERPQSVVAEDFQEDLITHLIENNYSTLHLSDAIDSQLILI